MRIGIMANKFDDEVEIKPGIDMSITLFDYFSRRADERNIDLLGQLRIMGSKNPLNFYQTIFENQKEHEKKREFKETVKWPYAERLVYLVQKFRTLDFEDQQTITDAVEALQIYWRGDDMPMFEKIIDETIMYRKLSEKEKQEYRKNLMTSALTWAIRHGEQTA